ncbi:MAG: class I SAM-dependent methyltransferase [Sulfuricaulis sp.]
MKFKDHFSGHADDYARYRPDYPAALFEFLGNRVSEHELAWDCGTGNGQAAFGLTAYFDRIIATDLSDKQIQNASKHEKIGYYVAPAEQINLPARSVDLITVAQALHWFPFEVFYQQVRRVLKPNGWLAVWCYGMSRVNPAVDQVVQHYYKNIVGPFWPPECHYIDEKYLTIPFPFVELPTPEFFMKAEWDFHDFVGYLHTWSATQRFKQQYEQNPIDIVRRALAKTWGSASARITVRWPLYLRLGRLTAPGVSAL